MTELPVPVVAKIFRCGDYEAARNPKTEVTIAAVVDK